MVHHKPKNCFSPPRGQNETLILSDFSLKCTDVINNQESVRNVAIFLWIPFHLRMFPVNQPANWIWFFLFFFGFFKVYKINLIWNLKNVAELYQAHLKLEFADLAVARWPHSQLVSSARPSKLKFQVSLLF